LRLSIFCTYSGYREDIFSGQTAVKAVGGKFITTHAKTGVEKLMTQDDFLLNMRLFGEDDDALASEAYDELVRQFRDSVVRHLQFSGLERSDCEDICQTVFVRLWASRKSFEVIGPAAMWCFLRKAARNCVIDESRRRSIPGSESMDELREVPDSDLPTLDVFVIASEDRRRFYALADELWLGISRDPDLNNARLLAAQLFYVHGWDWREIVDKLAIEEPGQLDEWLVDSSVVRHLAYAELYWDNDALTGYLLRPDNPLESQELDRLTVLARERSGPPPSEEFSWSEIQLVIWRVRNGLLTEKILRLEGCDRDGASLQLFYGGLTDRYPFTRIVKGLKEALDRHQVRQELADMRIWRRLVFQYHCSDSLPHKQIVERTGRAAEVVGSKVTEVTLVGWISLERIFDQFAKFAREEVA
jgi:hypothetical protein